eukprot:EG_transcript_24786
MSEFGLAGYWEERYAENDREFEWYLSYRDLQPLFDPLLSPEHRILVLGCGTSSLSAELYAAGYHRIVNVDLSESCVATMRERCRALPGMEWEVGDCTRLRYGEAEFDVVLDKGCMDALLCQLHGERDVHRMNLHVQRVLKPGGRFVVVSSGFPDTRFPLLWRKPLAWQVKYRMVHNTRAPTAERTEYHVYTMTKPVGACSSPCGTGNQAAHMEVDCIVSENDN